MNVSDLPPWGVMDRSCKEEIDHRSIPEAWRPLNGGDRDQEWKKWLDALVAELEKLWPQYLADSKKWKSPPNADLIDTDLDLMDELVKELDAKIGGNWEPKPPDERPTHLALFKEEDNPNDFFGTHYERYDPTFPAWLRAELGDLLWNGLDHRLGSLQLQLKDIFQRPRAYQVAQLLDRPGSTFKHQPSHLGNTPAFISGHCIQGTIGVCAIYPICATTVDLVSINVLKQFMVDIGDRRVFAGVHYPSDNLGSWYTAFKLLPHVMDASVVSAVRAFLWDAINNYSTVYASIKKHAVSKGSPYAPIVAELTKVATTN